MNDVACASIRDRRPSVTFPDIPPADLCRRHSCLDNFVLSACVAKASDNLARLDELLHRQRLTDTVKRSYRAAVARRRPTARAGGGEGGGDEGGGDEGGGGAAPAATSDGDESWTARRLARHGALLVDGHPPSGRLAQDVHGFLENLGTLLRRLERDIHKTWSRIQNLDASSEAVQGNMRRTSEGCSHKLEQSIETLWDDWRREQAKLDDERGQAQQQAVSMASSIAALQQRVGAVGQYVRYVREEANTVGEEARQDFARLRKLKERVRLVVRQRRKTAQNTAQVKQMLQRQQSVGEIQTLQRVVRRKQLSEKLQVSRRDAAAATSALQLIEEGLADAESDANSKAVQVSASLIELSKLSRSQLPELDENDQTRSVERVFVTMQDAFTQAVQRLTQVRSRQMQTDLACRDVAVQIGQLAKAEEVLGKEQQHLEIEIEGVKISKLCSSKHIRKNVNMITKRGISTRHKIQETIAKLHEANHAAESVQPEIFQLNEEIRNTEVKLKSVLNRQEPILARLTALRIQYEEEEDEERRRIEFSKGECVYQGQVRGELEARLSATQNQLQLELEQYELTLAETETLEDTFATRVTVARPALDELVRGNALSLRVLAEVARRRSNADHFIDEHGAEVMTQKVALTFAAQVQEAEMFELEQQVQELSSALEESRRIEAAHAEQIRRMTPHRDELAEEIACLDSELRWRHSSHDAQLARLRQMTALVTDWERLRRQLITEHQQYLRQARYKTDQLDAEYQRGVRKNAELRLKYATIVEDWLAARMRTASRFMPQVTLREDLCGRMQVIRLVRTGVYATDRTLGLRHLYFSGEHQRGQAKLGELYSTVRVMRDDIALACEHVVRMFIGLMKGDVPFVRRAEKETDVREEGAQTDAPPPADSRGREREERARRQKQRQLVMAVAEMGREDTASCSLPPVRRQAEKPVRGVSKLHDKDSKLHGKTLRLPKI